MVVDVAERVEEIKALSEGALSDSKKLEELVEALQIGTRRNRQVSAAALNMVAAKNPEILVPHIAEIVDALGRPEAQTRWECLDVLTALVPLDSKNCDKAVPEAEASLFDEESGPVRLAAMRFLCRLGGTTAKRSKTIWPLIDEGIQCYHGDLEFNDMLNAIIEFSEGKLDKEVKEQLASRMSFDATNAKGTLQKRAKQFVDNVSK